MLDGPFIHQYHLLYQQDISVAVRVDILNDFIIWGHNMAWWSCSLYFFNIIELKIYNVPRKVI